jgi:CheY-like chemotaxis protein
VLEHDGWVEVKDNQPGAVFEVYLPATDQAPASSFEEKVQPARRSGGETILLVDDQPEQNETIQKMLNSLGYKTFSVTSSGEAIAFVRSCRVDLAVLDMMMGDDINGCQIYEQMLEANPAQKAIIISGYSKTDEVARARILGVSQVLEKPVTLPAVSRAIRQALSGP